MAIFDKHHYQTKGFADACIMARPMIENIYKKCKENGLEDGDFVMAIFSTVSDIIYINAVEERIKDMDRNMNNL